MTRTVSSRSGEARGRSTPTVESYEGNLERAIALAGEGARHHADAHDRFCTAMVPFFLAVAGRTEEAIALSGEAVAAVEAAAVPSSMCAVQWAVARAVAASSPATAVAAADRAIAVARASGNRFWEVLCLSDRAALLAQSGDRVDALRSFRHSIDTWRRSPELVFAAHGLGSLVVLFERIGRVEPAATLHGAVLAALGFNPFVRDLAAVVDRIRQRLGTPQFEDASHRGALMELHEACDLALTEIEAAMTALGG